MGGCWRGSRAGARCTTPPRTGVLCFFADYESRSSIINYQFESRIPTGLPLASTLLPLGPRVAWIAHGKREPVHAPWLDSSTCSGLCSSTHCCCCCCCCFPNAPGLSARAVSRCRHWPAWMWPMRIPTSNSPSPGATLDLLR